MTLDEKSNVLLEFMIREIQSGVKRCRDLRGELLGGPHKLRANLIINLAYEYTFETIQSIDELPLRYTLLSMQM